MSEATIERAPGKLEIILEDHDASVVLRGINDRYHFVSVSVPENDENAHVRQYPGSVETTARELKETYEAGGLNVMKESDCLTVRDVGEAVAEAQIDR